MITIEKNLPNITVQLVVKRDLLEYVDSNGTWHRRVFAIIFLVYMHVAIHNMYMAFMAPNHDFWCARTSEAANLSILVWKRVGLPPNDHHCSRYENINFTNLPEENINFINLSEGSLNFTNLPEEIINDSYSISTISCKRWEYDHSFYTSTLISQWDLVCKKKWLVSLTKSIFVAGIFVSVIIFGHLSDRIGRKPVIITSSIITTIFATACAFSTTFTMFMVIRFFVALGLGGFYNTAFILMMEVLVPEMRPFYCMGVLMGWCLGYVCLPIIAWFIRDWFWIQVAVTVPLYFLTIILWKLPESPRWLLSQGKVEEAQTILLAAAETNTATFTATEISFENIINEARKVSESGDRNRTLLDLLRLRVMRKITLTLFFVWFVNSFIYFGLTFNTNELYREPFLNFALSGAIEMPAYFVSIFVTKSYGRRKPMSIAMIVGAIALLIRYGLPRAFVPLKWLSVMVSSVGKFFITCAFGILHMFSTELFPTEVRNIGLGTVSMSEMVGFVLAPYIRKLGDVTYPSIPHFVYGVLAAIGGISVLLLPETNNMIVPDTLEEFVQAISSTNEEKCSLLKKSNDDCRKLQKQDSTDNNHSTIRGIH